MRRQRQLGQVGHRRKRDAPALAQLQPFGRPALQQRRPQHRVERVGLLQALQGHLVARLAAQRRLIDQVAEGRPLRRCQCGEADPAVLRAVDAARVGGREAVDAAPQRNIAAGRGGAGGAFAEAQIGTEHIHIDAAPGPAAPAAQQRTQGRNDGGDAGDDLRRMAARQHRVAVHWPGGKGHAAHGLDHRVAAGPVAVGAVGGKPGQAQAQRRGRHRPQRRIGCLHLGGSRPGDQ